MSQESNLSASVRAALKTHCPVAPLTVVDVRSLARLAKAVNENAIAFLSELPPVQAEQHFVALQLIRAAFDHGRGLLHLVEENPIDMSGPALALHRSQLENFLRGIYIGFLASEEQVEDFLENDAGVRRKNHNGKWQNVGVMELAEQVELFVNALSDEPVEDAGKFSRMVSNAWSPLCGFVHGGRAIHALYLDGQGQIGADLPLDALVQVVSNCFVITNFGFLVVIARVHQLEGVPAEGALNVAMEEFMNLHRGLRAKQRS